MLRVAFRVPVLGEVVLGSGDRLVFGRKPPEWSESDESGLHLTTVALPFSSRHTSRVLGELVVGEEVAQLHWSGGSGAQLSSLFEAAGGPRRGVLRAGLIANLDPGENHLHILRGYQGARGTVGDLKIELLVSTPAAGASASVTGSLREYATHPDLDQIDRTSPAPRVGEREWFVALALAEPWLAGEADYPRPPTNREIFERVAWWRDGDAWTLDRPQRVDDAIRVIAAAAFGARDNPCTARGHRRVNVRGAVGRRAAEVELVTPEDLRGVNQRARQRQRERMIRR